MVAEDPFGIDSELVTLVAVVLGLEQCAAGQERAGTAWHASQIAILRIRIALGKAGVQILLVHADELKDSHMRILLMPPIMLLEMNCIQLSQSAAAA